MTPYQKRQFLRGFREALKNNYQTLVCGEYVDGKETSLSAHRQGINAGITSIRKGANVCHERYYRITDRCNVHSSPEKFDLFESFYLMNA